MSRRSRNESVVLWLKDAPLRADLFVPQDCVGLVIFSHGSGSSRMSPRNRAVARTLREAGIGTLLLDLLTEEEEREDEFTGHLRFDIRLLTQRLIGATRAAQQLPGARGLSIAYFGASTGAASALIAAAQLPAIIKAVVSRGGRPDLAAEALPEVRAPVLLIVGGDDPGTFALNQGAMKHLTTEKKLVVVPGAGPLFEEEGTLEEVARQARDWFLRNFRIAPHTLWEARPRRHGACG